MKVWSPSDKAEFVMLSAVLKKEPLFQGPTAAPLQELPAALLVFRTSDLPIHPARTASGTFLLAGFVRVEASGCRGLRNLGHRLNMCGRKLELSSA